MKKIKSALISVFHKDGLDEIVKRLDEHGVLIYSTGGTYDYICNLGIKAETVESLTGYPSILGGRVKTLHPKVFGGILSRRDNPKDGEQTKEYGEVEFENVSFSYDKSKELIKNLSISAKPGQRVAIVGPTGCGKSTLINLLMRFYDPDSGMIKVDGENSMDFTRKSLRKNFGMVLQETWLKSGTVRENIAYSNPDATDEEIIAAAKLTHAHSFIKRLPDGYDTVLGENGGSLSQGQKQLLCITRVLLNLPPMLILDEATSSIDSHTEIRIQKTFARMMKGRTCFVVAHRLSTIRESDIILVMNKGQIIEQGTHEQLLEKHGFYYDLYNSQFAVTE